MVCPDCKGQGYREFEAGLIRLRCHRCEGAGIGLVKTVDTTCENDESSDNRNRPDIREATSKNTLQSSKSSKYKACSKCRKVA